MQKCCVSLCVCLLGGGFIALCSFSKALDSRKFKNTLLNLILLLVKYQILFKNEIPHFKQLHRRVVLRVKSSAGLRTKAQPSPTPPFSTLIPVPRPPALSFSTLFQILCETACLGRRQFGAPIPSSHHPRLFPLSCQYDYVKGFG